MITTKEIKLKIEDLFSSEIVEEKLKRNGFDVLRWAVVDINGNEYTLNIAIVE